MKISVNLTPGWWTVRTMDLTWIGQAVRLVHDVWPNAEVRMDSQKLRAVFPLTEEHLVDDFLKEKRGLRARIEGVAA